MAPSKAGFEKLTQSQLLASHIRLLVRVLNNQLTTSTSLDELIETNVWIGVQTVDAVASGLFWCLFPELLGNKGNEHQNKTRMSA